MPIVQVTYDPALIQANLGVLRTFRRGEGEGVAAAKLYVHPDGRFERMESGFRTAWRRTFGNRQQSLSDDFVLQAVYDLFEEAARAVPRSNALAIATNVGSDQRPLRDFVDAYRGFANLALDYDKSRIPRLYASKILDECVRPVIGSIVFPAIRGAQDTARLLSFNQGRFLDPDDAGKCFGFTMEWARRYIMTGKFSFTEHNPDGRGSYGRPLPPPSPSRDPADDVLEDVRRLYDFNDWMRKRMARVALLHDDQRYHERVMAPDPLSPGDDMVIGKKASLQRAVMRPAAPEQLDRLLRKVGAIKRVYLRDIRPPDPRWLAMPSDYRSMCADIVRDLWDDLGTSGRLFAQAKVTAWNQQLAVLRRDHPDRASDPALADLPLPVLTNPHTTVRVSYVLHWYGNYVFPHDGNVGSGHTMGLHFYFPAAGVPRYIFFDPNFGEYEVMLHNPALPDVTAMACIFAYYSTTFDMNRYTVDRMWEE